MPRSARPRLVRCAECNLKRIDQRAAQLGATVCRRCRERAVAAGQVDPAQAPLPFEPEEKAS